MQTFGCRGVLVYGSAADEDVRPGSDIDVLGLTDVPQLRSVQTSFAGQEIDLFLGGTERLAQTMQRDVAGNGNFVLRALVQGRVLLDQNNSFELLVQQAHRRWTEGPSVVGQHERRVIRARCLKITRAAHRMARSETYDAAQLQLREVQVSVFLDMLVKDFCRIHRRWASSLREMGERTEFGELQVKVRRYMHSDGLAERLLLTAVMAQEIADAARTHAGAPTDAPAPGLRAPN